MTDLFVGRQPIFDKNLNIYAYELLFRSGQDNQARVSDGEDATTQVLVNTFAQFGIDHIVGKQLAFINFTRKFLLDEAGPPIPPDRVVVEILEDVLIDDVLVDSVHRLQSEGFTIALDDFVYHEQWLPLLEIADIVKLDVLDFSLEETRQYVERLKPYKAKLLAEKIETENEFEVFRDMGFDYFQGFFLAKPRVISGKKIPSNHLVVLKLITALQKPDADYQEVEKLICMDASLSFQILRHINSAFIALPSKVNSIHQAIVYLGLKETKRLATLIAMSSFDERPSEILATALVRAKTCELLAEAAGLADQDIYFTLGLFSVLDSLLQIPMEELLEKLPLETELKQALLGEHNCLGEALRCARSYEGGSDEGGTFNESYADLTFMSLTPDHLQSIYLQALGWSTQSSEGLW